MTYVYNSQLDAFTIYHVVREEPKPQPVIGPALPALGHATSGAVGTAISKLLTYPLELVITRLQVQRQFQASAEDADYDGIIDAIEKIYETEGVSAFYSGVAHETVKGVADSFLFFLAYTYARQKRLSSQGVRRLSVIDEIGVGYLAGAFAKFFTTPLQNVVTRKQAAAMIVARDPTSSISPNLSTKDIALQIRQEKGLQGFWSGYSASLILSLNPSITFLLHRVLLRLLVPKARQADPGARTAFLLAAFSKAMASTITYPFSLAKTRAQVSSQKPSQETGPTSESEKPEPINNLVESKAVRARERTVLSTILRIAKTEGLLALYQGLGGEVLKAFFSHGITMLVKARIHTLVVSLYYLVLKTLKKYPNPEEVAQMASEQAKDVFSRGTEAAGNAATMAQDAFSNSKQPAGDLLEKGRNAASNRSKQAQESFVRATVKDINAGDDES